MYLSLYDCVVYTVHECTVFSVPLRYGAVAARRWCKPPITCLSTMLEDAVNKIGIADILVHRRRDHNPA